MVRAGGAAVASGTDIPTAANVALALQARAENVLLVRQALRGLADAAALAELELNDLTTAVTEACNNVVSHAYEGDPGPLEVELRLEPSEIEVLVRDHGHGIGRARSTDRAAPEGGLGVHVIRALARCVHFRETAGGGTEVAMRFAISVDPALRPKGSFDAVAPGTIALPAAGETARLAVGPPALARSVLRRVIAAAAMRARFTTERIAAAQRLSDALVAQLSDAPPGGRLGAAIGVRSRELELIVGPLRQGSAHGPLTSLLDEVADSHELRRTPSGEILAMHLRESAASRR